MNSCFLFNVKIPYIFRFNQGFLLSSFRFSTVLAVCFCCLEINGLASADDWPQWNGPTRDGVVHEAGILTRIPDAGLKLLWRKDVQLGYSGPATANGLVYIFDYAKESGTIVNKAGTRDELTGRERLLCMNALTGELLWKDEYDRPYAVSYGSGPRATPTVYNGLVYALGAEGHLRCLDARTGKRKWIRDFKKEFGAETPLWGHAASPLVYGDSLICMVGGDGSLVVAFDLLTGREQWRALSSKETGYCPPSLIAHNGVEQLLIWSPGMFSSVNPQSGQLNWQEELAPKYGMSIMPPISEGDLLFAGGEGSVGAMFRLRSDSISAEIVWRGAQKIGVYLATSAAVFDHGYLYGADIGSGALICARASDGERMWQSAVPTTGSTRGRGGAHGTAFLLKCGDGDYLIFSETGDFISAKLTPEGYSETGRFHAIEPTGTTMGRDYVWTFPAISDGRLYLRNDVEVVCYDLRE
jgi:outer membrane protein assembly factor BamB